MDLLHNPFHILGATSHDESRKIRDLAEERSLILDSDEPAQAASVLTKPRERLSAEIAWLPGISPSLTDSVLSQLENTPRSLIGVTGLSPLVRANLLSDGILQISQDTDWLEIGRWGMEIAYEFEKIIPEEICDLINNDRQIAGFPKITSLSSVEEEIEERRRCYLADIKSALDNLPSIELVRAVTTMAENTTGRGNKECPGIISDIVALFEKEAAPFFEKEEENIQSLIRKIKIAAAGGQDFALSSMVRQLIRVGKNWDLLAQPIQICAKAQGLKHKKSFDITGWIRELSGYLYNEYDQLELALQLTIMLQEVFAEVEEIVEMLDRDVQILRQIQFEQEEVFHRNRMDKDKIYSVILHMLYETYNRD